MNHEIQFRFNELDISRTNIISTMGYEGCELPEPFFSYLNEVYRFASTLKDIRVVCRSFDDIEIREFTGELYVEDTCFHLGKTLLKEIRNSNRIVFFICTAGVTISKIAKDLMSGEDPVLGYIYDVMGSYIAEAAGDKMQKTILSKISEKGEKITNRYSPGYVKWPVVEQHELFRLFNNQTGGVSLTSSALMVPGKSISGLFGIGKEVKFRKNPCDLCNSKQCTFRNTKAGIIDGCSNPV